MTIIRRFARIFIDRVPLGMIPAYPWLCNVRWDARTQRSVMVIWPFHYAAQFAWWVNLRWSMYKGKPSWIDRTLDAEFYERRNSDRWWRRGE